MENQIEKETRSLANWLDGSIIVKLGIIAVITLLLLIPASLIQDLILERQSRKQEAIAEVSKKWSSAQLISGPVMVIPYKSIEKSKDENGKENFTERLTNIYLLPEQLTIDGQSSPEILHRGIFDAVVYNAKVKVKGNFSSIELQKSGIDERNILWGKAHLVIGLTDLKGLKNNPEITYGEQKYPVEMDFYNSNLFENNLVIVPDFTANKTTSQSFSYELDIRGSEALNFLPLGRNTNVNIAGTWTDPSFDGEYLPEKRDVTDSSFTASWSIPSFNRKYPQQWMEPDARLVQDLNIQVPATKVNQAGTSTISTQADSSFGVKFLLPVDGYQMTMRTAKYGILIIMLTFVSLFFTEILIRKNVHIIQYVLIGVSMVVYYSLLLSFSEQFGFNIAYLIASASTVILISLFISSILKNKKAAVIFACILSIFYIFIFVIMQLQELSLLFGSIALFIIVAILMYFSGKINWDKRV